jgi:GNAT superfamily N-acetyltransferase
MCEEWMPNVSLALSAEQFEQLPRNPAYQYDYHQGTAVLTPRPKHYHGVLDFAGWRAPDPQEVSADVHIRSLDPGDHAALPELFADAFVGVQPFGGQAKERRLSAARLALEKTWQNGDGPWVQPASFLAVHSDKKIPLGAILITLVPGGDPGDADSYLWLEPPAPGLALEVSGQPHLTWIFVSPLWKAGGLGSALLDRAVSALKSLGHASLWTTFLLGNDASMLWHWRNGFVLAPFPLSRRVLRRETRGRGNFQPRR